VLLCQAGYLTLREGQLFAGPLLETFDDREAADEVRELLARNQRLTHLRDRAAAFRTEAEQDSSTASMAQAPLGGRGGSELLPHRSGIEADQAPGYGDFDA